jgi:hypothetical protein
MITTAIPTNNPILSYGERFGNGPLIVEEVVWGGLYVCRSPRPGGSHTSDGNCANLYQPDDSDCDTRFSIPCS